MILFCKQQIQVHVFCLSGLEKWPYGCSIQRQCLMRSMFIPWVPAAGWPAFTMLLLWKFNLWFRSQGKSHGVDSGYITSFHNTKGVLCKAGSTLRPLLTSEQIPVPSIHPFPSPGRVPLIQSDRLIVVLLICLWECCFCGACWSKLFKGTFSRFPTMASVIAPDSHALNGYNFVN